MMEPETVHLIDDYYMKLKLQLKAETNYAYLLSDGLLSTWFPKAFINNKLIYLDNNLVQISISPKLLHRCLSSNSSFKKQN